MALPYVPDAVRPLRRVEYDKLIELGMFGEDERVELLRGFLVPMSPIGPPHSSTVDRLNRALTLALGRRALVRVQNPIAALEDSEPQPDLAVVPEGDYDEGHPESALLLIEVADSSLREDRGVKLGIYAECGVPEYWVVNLRDRRIEVYSDPEGLVYRSARFVTLGESVSPACFPDVSIGVSDVIR